jgi:hypothetical protein
MIEEKEQRMHLENMLFMSMGWDDVSELWPPTGLLFISQAINEYGQPQWNDIEKGQPNISDKNLS